jgi:hypothetical protein
MKACVVLTTMYETRLYVEAFQDEVATAYQRAGQRRASAAPVPAIVVSDGATSTSPTATTGATTAGGRRPRANTDVARTASPSPAPPSDAPAAPAGAAMAPGDDHAVRYRGSQGGEPEKLTRVDLAGLDGLLESAIDQLVRQVRSCI